MRRSLLGIAAAGLLLLGGTAVAQTSQPVRVRATIDTVSGETLNLTSRTGEKLTVALAPNAQVSGLVVTDITMIKPGSFIGTAAVPAPNGQLRALEVHVFPESMRGLGEGHRPWDSGKDSSMTNGTVGTVTGTTERTLQVSYKGGEKTVIVPADVPIVTFDEGDHTLLQPGAHIIVFTTKGADGTLSADRVVVGRNGITPPM
ncbi:MAG: hypothetical protein P4M00_00625 [Azospirillaceae bacterium]|nr:hypothetical protein [Azospirillaceae bacterium]